MSNIVGMPLVTRSMLSSKLRGLIEHSAALTTIQENTVITETVGTTMSIVGGDIDAFNPVNDYLEVFRNGRKLSNTKFSIVGADVVFESPFIIGDEIILKRGVNSILRLDNIPGELGAYVMEYHITEEADSVDLLPEGVTSFVEEIDTVIVSCNTTLLHRGEQYRFSDDLTTIIPLDDEGNDSVWVSGSTITVYYFRY